MTSGCEILPDLADGAIFLAPLIEQQALEASVKFRADHIVVAQPDQATVERVLATIPKRRRPGVQFAKHEHLLGVQLEFSRRLLYVRFVSRSRQRTGPGTTVRSSGHGRRMLFVDGGVASSEILAIATSTCQRLDYRWCDGEDNAGGCTGS
jgi:hypothetical protein